MADGRYSWTRMSLGRAVHLVHDDPDDDGDWELPDDDILVPAHLLPPYQDEDDETVLPSQAHPSYPYGNPYKDQAFTSPSRTKGRSRGAHLSSFAHPLTHSTSLATSLPALELRQLFERTTFGDPLDRQWGELNLPGLLGPKTRIEREEDRQSQDAMYNAHGDAGTPAGQNSADATAGGDGQAQDSDDETGAGEPPGVATTQQQVREMVAGELMHEDNS
ncbi:hypothetical protein BMF94_7101 [Rhodotorula taiwanensis]|uniref:Uncharacterized protein n=1 Tax=Rhodotorula taiwanensis TaxID=741276 RepID=A0A2S5AZC2_9BASI|nr:hypothetical protein BMF94_7101 [Rhodotorula taiwanensis]